MYLWTAVGSCRFCVPYKRADLKPGTHKPHTHPTHRGLYRHARILNIHISISASMSSATSTSLPLSLGRNTCACSPAQAHNSCISMRLHTRAICQRMPKLEHFDALIRGKAGHELCCSVMAGCCFSFPFFFFLILLLLFILNHTGVFSPLEEARAAVAEKFNG